MSYKISDTYKIARNVGAGLMAAALTLVPVKGIDLEAIANSLVPNTKQEQVVKAPYLTLNDAVAEGSIADVTEEVTK